MVTWDRRWFYHLVSGYDRDTILATELPQGRCYDIIDLPCGKPAWVGADRSDRIVWGCWLVSSWAPRCVYLIRMTDAGRATVTEWVNDIRGPAKLGNDAKRNRVLIPLFLDDALLIRPGPRMEAP